MLVDTLLGQWLPAWQARAKVTEARHPKFYFFDPGVVRAVAGRIHDPLGQEERGALLETLVLHEMRAWIKDGPLSILPVTDFMREIASGAVLPGSA